MPSPASNLVATPGYHSVTLTWDWTFGTGPSGWEFAEVYQNNIYLTGTATTPFLIEDLDPEVEYAYEIRAGYYDTGTEENVYDGYLGFAYATPLGDPIECPWTAISNNDWITITGGASGTTDATVTYSVTENTGPQRVGTLTIAGYTHTVTQEAAEEEPPPTGGITHCWFSVYNLPMRQEIDLSSVTLTPEQIAAIIAIIGGVTDGVITPTLALVTDIDGNVYTDEAGDFYYIPV